MTSPAGKRQHGWVSAPAVAWALDSAPDLPAQLLGILVAVARFASEDGRNAYPSIATLAATSRKSERQVRRDLRDLEKLGLLVPGDPGVVAHFSADRRPNVYDLPLWRGDVDDPSRGDVHDRSSDQRGDTDVRSRGVMGDRSGGTPMTPKEPMNNPGKNPEKKTAAPASPSSSSSPTTKTTRDRKAKQRAAAVADVRQRTGATAEEASAVIDAVLDNAGKRVGDVAAYLRGCPAEDLAEELDTYRDDFPYGPTTDWVRIEAADTLIKAMDGVADLGKHRGEARDLMYAAMTRGHSDNDIVTTVNDYGRQAKDLVAAWIAALTDLAEHAPGEPIAA